LIRRRIRALSTVCSKMRLFNRNHFGPYSPQLKLLLLAIIGFGILCILFVGKSFYDKKVGAEEIPDSGMLLCPAPSNITNYRGRLSMESISNDIQEADIQANNNEIQLGGHWKPSNCESRTKVAIVIPYRDRQQHVYKFLNHIFPILQTQLLDFRIIVVEQNGTDLFNRACLLNAGASLAQELGVDCLVLHDVDMLPENDKIPYACSKNPRHLGAFVNTMNYNPVPYYTTGGVLSIKTADYVKVNGHSNSFWGWGGEDDELAKRLISQYYIIERLDPKVDRYTMLSHAKEKSVNRREVIRLISNSHTRSQMDGFKQEVWTVISVEKRPLYYHLLVDVGKSPEVWGRNANSTGSKH